LEDPFLKNKNKKRKLKSLALLLRDLIKKII